ncbi:iron-containing alcohol dehydrogenase [Daejeonella oryzae]|uniref:iron-containing alcohol dehydrogenase n=1 Tax=Daejeonella oryzae TaxID=1122943 RepID=UPI000412E003|nr:iron-containing alcohol dehydrogenase [Daejeonella oryzae]
MENFELNNPTKIIFGKNCIDQIPNEIHWKKALVIIGQASVKKNGFYARVISLLNMSGMHHVTFEGVPSNPTSELADKAISIAKKFQAEVIIAIGGGSVIDTAKAVSVGFYAEHPVWDFYTKKAIPTKALPVVCILTLAACGTENNSFSYLQNNSQGLKMGFSSLLLYPHSSYLDPTITFSVDTDCTAYGISNLIAHTLEQYFAEGDSPLSDYYATSIIKLAIKYGKRALENPDDYEARANIMWLSANALNGSLLAGKLKADWGCHGIEQTLNVLYNTQHGRGLSIIYPAWLKYFKLKISDKTSFLAREVFEIAEPDPVKASELFILKLEDFFRSINCPTRLSDLNIAPSQNEIIIENLIANKVSGKAFRLGKADYEGILEYMS